MIRRAAKWIGILFGIILLIAAAYVCYVVFSYSRIEDLQPIQTEGNAADAAVKTDEPYTIVTQNCGFGAYTPDFTFFMDGGKQSWANSKESVISCIGKAAEEALSFDPDFVLFQEIDTGSTRSYQVDERAQMISDFPGYASAFAVNYHSAFLMYPLTQPHGASNSGILTFSKAQISGAVRRSLEISTGFSKFLDLDRCYSVSRIPVENGKELLLYNVHLSAYGGSDDIRKSQMTQLFEDMKSEYEQGNYCVCGGDFNHDFTGDSTQVLNQGSNKEFGWAMPFPADLLPSSISRCTDYEDTDLVPTCRNCDVPYGDDCMTFVIDGFLVTDNVQVDTVRNIDTGFVYSDHNPVVMTFSLTEASS